MKTIAVFNSKGGVGKSMTSREVSVRLNELGKKVLQVDLDPQANTTSMFVDLKENLSLSNLEKVKERVLEVDGESKFSELAMCMEPEDNVADTSLVIKHPEKVEEVIRTTKFEGLDIIASSLRLATTEKELQLELGEDPRETRMLRALQRVKRNYDYAILDCPPSQNMMMINAMKCADLILIPVTPEKGAFDGLISTLRSYYNLKDKQNIKADFRIFFNMVKRNKFDSLIMEVIEAAFPGKVLNTRIMTSQSRVVSEVGFLKSFLVKDKKQRIGSQLCELTDEIQSLFEEEFSYGKRNK